MPQRRPPVIDDDDGFSDRSLSRSSFAPLVHHF